MAKTEAKRIFPVTKADGTPLKLSVRLPNQKETQIANRQYRAAYTQALMDGQPPRSVLLKRLGDNGLWSQADRAEFSSLREAYLAALDQANRVEIPAGQTATAEEVETFAKRDRALGALNAKRADVEAMLQFTADAMAEEAKTKYVIACVVEYDGKDARRVFSSVEELDSTPDVEMLERVKYEFATLEAGMPSDWDNIMANDAAEKATETAKVDDAPADKKDEKVEAVTPPVIPSEGALAA
jgi:hypothetical protein